MQLLREAPEIVDGAGLGHSSHLRAQCDPVRGNGKDGLGLRESLGELGPGLGKLVVLEGVGGAAVAQEQGWHQVVLAGGVHHQERRGQ